MAASWDNSGLQVGDPNRRVRIGIIALDVVPQVVEEAIRLGATLIVTHHPLLFRPVGQLTPDTFTASLALRLAEEKIALYSIHTNLDAAPDGVSIALAHRLGLNDVQCLDPSAAFNGGYGAIGQLSQPVPLADFLERVATALESPSLRYAGNLQVPVYTVAVCGGAGVDLVPTALARGADGYVTADIRYHQYFDVLGTSGEARMALINAGHYETEVHTENLLRCWLDSRFPQVTWYRTTIRTGPVRSYTHPSLLNR